jgi:hypothetical protein
MEKGWLPFDAWYLDRIFIRCIMTMNAFIVARCLGATAQVNPNVHIVEISALGA